VTPTGVVIEHFEQGVRILRGGHSQRDVVVVEGHRIERDPARIGPWLVVGTRIFEHWHRLRSTVGSGAMTHTPDPWEPPLAGTEVEHLLASIDRLRATFHWKSRGLDARGLSHRLPSSSLSLGGLLKHLARVEDEIFFDRFLGEPLPEPWASAPWDTDPEWEFTSARDDSPDALYELWNSATARSRETMRRALSSGGLDQPSKIGWNGEMASLRRLMFDLVEEYGRHTGHADLLREAVDGVTGEDPPSGMPWPPR